MGFLSYESAKTNSPFTGIIFNSASDYTLFDESKMDTYFISVRFIEPSDKPICQIEWRIVARNRMHNGNEFDGTTVQFTTIDTEEAYNMITKVLDDGKFINILMNWSCYRNGENKDEYLDFTLRQLALLAEFCKMIGDNDEIDFIIKMLEAYETAQLFSKFNFKGSDSNE